MTQTPPLPRYRPGGGWVLAMTAVWLASTRSRWTRMEVRWTRLRMRRAGEGANSQTRSALGERNSPCSKKASWRYP